MKACENKPNCVSSYDKRSKFYMDPIVVPEAKWGEAKSLILEAVKKVEPGVKVKESSENFLHVVVETSWMKFKDDLCFWFDGAEHKVYVKSQSRVGYWDLGKNRNRLKSIRTEFGQAVKKFT